MPNEFEKATIVILKESITYSDKAIVSKHILKKQTGNVSIFAFDQGEALSEHTAPFDAFVMVLDGKADIKINGESHILQTGETIVMPANVPHAVVAVEKFKMLLTMIKSETAK